MIKYVIKCCGCKEGIYDNEADRDMEMQKLNEYEKRTYRNPEHYYGETKDFTEEELKENECILNKHFNLF